MATPRERDGCVVDTEPLSAAVRDFVDSWKKNRPQTAGQLRGNARMVESDHISALQFISETTQRIAQSYDPDARGVPRATIQRVQQLRSATTELRTADAILTAIGRADMLSPLTGSLSIRPNPLASPSARSACCGGSLTGAAEAA